MELDNSEEKANSSSDLYFAVQRLKAGCALSSGHNWPPVPRGRFVLARSAKTRRRWWRKWARL